MENLEIILSIAGTALGLLITAATFLAKFIQSARGKKAAQDIIKIGEAILPFIRKAEEFIHYSGEEKKAYVMTKANDFAIKHGIEFKELAISQEIEKLVALTKAVNRREKDVEDQKEVA